MNTAQPYKPERKVYCQKHYPTPKNLQAADTMETRRAKEGPHLATVNNQVRGDGMQTNLQSADTMETRKAKEAPKLGTVNTQVRGDGMQQNAQVADMATSSALAAPKLDVVGKRDEMAAPAPVLDMASQHALEAPKLEVAGGVQRGTGEKSNFNIII